MSNKNQYHVSKNITGGWKATKGGQVLSTHNTQEQAIEYAKYNAQLTRGEVVVHGKDGKIREKNSYGNDPFPPLG